MLNIPQSTTEQILEARLQELGVRILKPEKAIGLKSTQNGTLEVTFESGMIISARYVVGADGARSVVSIIVTPTSDRRPDNHP